MDRFSMNGQESENLDNIISYPKIVLVFDEHQKIKSLLPNLPPAHMKIKLFVNYWLLSSLDWVKKSKQKLLQNINTVNSNNLLATLLIGEKKFNLALARLLFPITSIHFPKLL